MTCSTWNDISQIFPNIRNKVCSRVLLTIAYATYLSCSFNNLSVCRVETMSRLWLMSLRLLGPRITCSFNNLSLCRVGTVSRLWIRFLLMSLRSQRSLALSSRDTVPALDSFPVNKLEILGARNTCSFNNLSLCRVETLSRLWIISFLLIILRFWEHGGTYF